MALARAWRKYNNLKVDNYRLVKSMITRVQHIGLAVNEVKEFSEKWDKLFGLPTMDLRDD